MGINANGDRVVGHQIEQRVLAAIIMMGGYVDRAKGPNRSGYVTNRIQRMMAHPPSVSSIGPAISQLEAKGKLIVERNGRLIVALATTDDVKADDWAMEELRKIVMERKKNASNKPVEAPAAYEAKPAWKRDENIPHDVVSVVPEKVVVINEAPATSSGGDIDYERLAIEMMKVAVANITQPKVSGIPKSEFEAIKKELKSAKDYAFNLEQENSAIKAQRDQMENNLVVAIDAAKDLQDQVLRLKNKLKAYEDNANRGKYKLDAIINDDSKAAITSIMRGDK